MKLIYNLTLLFTGLAFIVSCSDDDFDRNPVLELSENSVTFTKTAETKSVDVTKNETDDFYYTVTDNSTTDSWIEITKSATGFEISVTTNIETTARTATIKVVLQKGDLEKTVTVTQQAEDEFTYTVSKSKLNFSYGEESSVIYVETNTEEDWEVSVSDNSVRDWLTFDLSEQEKGKFVVKVLANSDINPREAEVNVAFPNKVLTINVTQRGIIHFDFPLLNIGFNYGNDGEKIGFKYPNSLGEAAEYEKARGSVWKSGTSLTNRYTTTSTIFPEVTYTQQAQFTVIFTTVKLAIAECPTVKPFALLEDPMFMKYMSDCGFEFSYRNEAREIAVYWSKEKEIAIQFCNYDLPVGYGNRLIFSYSQPEPDDEDNQTNSYKTLDAFPYPFTQWGASAVDLAEWEAKTGSTLLEGSSNSLQMYTPDLAQEPYCIERAYFMDTEQTPAALSRILIVFNRVDLGFYTNGHYIDSGLYIMTKEMKALLASAGFIFDKTYVLGYIKYHAYNNAEKGLRIRVYVDNYLDEDLLPRLTIEVTPHIPAP